MQACHFVVAIGDTNMLLHCYIHIKCLLSCILSTIATVEKSIHVVYKGHHSLLHITYMYMCVSGQKASEFEGLCLSQTTCALCISASADCAWCYDEVSMCLSHSVAV